MAAFTGTAGGDVANVSGTLTGFTGGTLAELQDALGDTFIGLDGNDTIIAGNGDDRITGGAGGDIMRGGLGNDTFVFNTADVAAGEVIDGGGGAADTIELGSYVDFTSLGANIFSIERIVSVGQGGNTNTRAQFTSSQFGAGLASSLLLVGSAATTDGLFITMNTPTFSAAGFTFSTWSAIGNDVILINGTAANETVTGSSQRDTINGGGGVDQIFAGGGDDLITIYTTNIDAGSTYDGGGGTADLLNVNPSSSAIYDFRMVTLAGIERVSLGSASSPYVATTMQFSFSQIGPGVSATGAWFSARAAGNVSNNSSTLVFHGDATTNTLNLSGMTFPSWDTDDRVAIVGDASAEVLTGSPVADDFYYSDGADVMSGMGGDDVFLFRVGALVPAGETIDGGAGMDAIRLAQSSVPDLIQFQTGTISSIERLDFRASSSHSIAQFSAAQAANGLASNLVIDFIPDGAFANPELRFVMLESTAIDISGYTFTSNQFRPISIAGDGDGETITGSSRADLINAGGGNDFIRSGGGADTINAGDGNDTVYWHPSLEPANLSGGADFDTLVVEGGTIPISVNLEAYNFEAARFEDVDTGSQPWTTQTRYYSAGLTFLGQPAWLQTQHYVTYDNGTALRSGYANHLSGITWINPLDWTQEYDNDGTLVRYTDYDQAPGSSNTWASFYNLYDGVTAVQTQKFTTYDNGTTARQGYDAGGNVDWLQEYAANGNLSRYTDYDQGGNQGFTYFYNLYDTTTGLQTQKFVQYDNGTTLRQGFDSHGHLDWQEERRADNTMAYYTDWDQDDGASWLYFVNYHNAAGTLYARHIFNDDGSDYWI